MSADLTEDQEELLKAAIEFGRASLRQDAEMIDADRDSEFDAEGWKNAPNSDFSGCLFQPTLAAWRRFARGFAVMEGLGYATRDQGLLFSGTLISGRIRFRSLCTATKDKSVSIFLYYPVASGLAPMPPPKQAGSDILCHAHSCRMA